VTREDVARVDLNHSSGTSVLRNPSFPARVARVFISLTLAGAPVHRAVAQAAADTSNVSAAVAFAERAAVRALHFTAGDAQSLRAGREDFTDSAWSALMKQYAGFLDSRGAPEFSSLFTRAGDAIVGVKNGVVHVKIPGTLTQSSGGSRTTYRVSVDVDVGGSPPRIRRLLWNTCAGDAAKRFCM
jgi:hypothetical protein